ncbi:MAG: hypothetical protein KBC24_06815 [Caldisericia bacterium]|nr:hypothetical protein [Caldisericia bacterium]
MSLKRVLTVGAAIIVSLVIVLFVVFYRVPTQKAALIPGRDSVCTLGYDLAHFVIDADQSTLESIKEALSTRINTNTKDGAGNYQALINQWSKIINRKEISNTMDFNINIYEYTRVTKTIYRDLSGKEISKEEWGKLREKLQERYTLETNLAELLEKSSEGLLSLEGQKKIDKSINWVDEQMKKVLKEPESQMERVISFNFEKENVFSITLYGEEIDGKYYLNLLKYPQA